MLPRFILALDERNETVLRRLVAAGVDPKVIDVPDLRVRLLAACANAGAIDGVLVNGLDPGVGELCQEASELGIQVVARADAGLGRTVEGVRTGQPAAGGVSATLSQVIDRTGSRFVKWRSVFDTSMAGKWESSPAVSRFVDVVQHATTEGVRVMVEPEFSPVTDLSSEGELQRDQVLELIVEACSGSLVNLKLAPPSPELGTGSGRFWQVLRDDVLSSPVYFMSAGANRSTTLNNLSAACRQLGSERVGFSLARTLTDPAFEVLARTASLEHAAKECVYVARLARRAVLHASS